MDPRTLMSMFQSGGGGYGGGGPSRGLESIISGLMGGAGDPYKDAMKQYQEWAGKAEGTQNPFLQFGQRGMPLFEKWLGGMQDPSGFINKLMGGYQESPFAKFQQEQALRAAGNQGAFGGLTGSTPMAQFTQQNARDISSQDMNQWLQNVLGINQQYGAGLGGQIGVGQHAADQLTGLYGDMGRQMAEQAYNKQRAEQMQKAGLWGGLFDVAKHGLFG